VAVKRFISAEQWRDPQQLQRLITSLRVSLTIERGESPPLSGFAEGARVAAL